MKRPLILIVGLAALVAAAALAAVLLWLIPGRTSAAQLTAGTLFLPDDRRIVDRGRYLYQASCAECHGANLEGQANWQQRGADGLMPAPPHDATGHTWHHPDQVLFELTKYGMQRYAGRGYRSAMPAYRGVLSDEDIIAVMSYVKSRWPASIRRQHDSLNARSAGQSSLHRWDALIALAARADR